MKNKIGWCNLTWNPAIGCKRNCDYCYGRTMNDRFGFIKKWDNPEWKEKNFNKRFPQKSQKIFVGSISEIYYWDKVWIQKVIDKTKQYPQHIFQFLTKFPEVYKGWVFPGNCWLGVTITDNKMLHNIAATFNYKNRIKFTSIEPILEYIGLKDLSYLDNFDWLILGAETGNRKGKIIPKKEWIKSLVDYCRDNDIPIYLKNSLRNIYPKEIKEFPETELKLF